ncbi:MAG: GIY-YIG nuclease family protein [Proteobacteria bacterium]|nr:GIY-YIG nuclease family protein [Pseudomonadota bacterium]
MIFNELHKISYVGYTININNRLKAHNTNKGAKFTRGKLWKLIYFRKFKNKILAMKFEYKLKKDRILRKKITSKFLHNQ